jgi:hypothetical protein
MESIKYFSDEFDMKKATTTPWWKEALIKMFGVKVTSCDSGTCCVCYVWRDKILVSEFYEGKGNLTGESDEVDKC